MWVQVWVLVCRVRDICKGGAAWSKEEAEVRTRGGPGGKRPRRFWMADAPWRGKKRGSVPPRGQGINGAASKGQVFPGGAGGRENRCWDGRDTGTKGPM